MLSLHAAPLPSGCFGCSRRAVPTTLATFATPPEKDCLAPAVPMGLPAEPLSGSQGRWVWLPQPPSPHLTLASSHACPWTLVGGHHTGHLTKGNRGTLECLPTSPCQNIPATKTCIKAEYERSPTYSPPPPRAQEPAMFDRGTKGRFLRTLFPQNLTSEPGVGSCA